MSRMSRESFKSNFFHVIVQGNEKRYIFEKYRSKEKYLSSLVKKADKYNIKILAYCIMDNHAHILIYTEKISDLSGYMNSVNTSFGLYYNKMNSRVGYVFKSRYKSVPIRSQKQLYRTLAYIHLNPVNAKMCKYPELYLYSSYNDFIKKRGIIFKPETFQLLNLMQDDYIDFFKFIHYMKIDDIGEDKEYDRKVIEKIIQEYIDENEIKDIIFESDKVKKMLFKLKSQRISISNVANFFNISVKRLKEIISD